MLLVLTLLYSYVEFTENDYPNSGFFFENYQRFNNTEITFRAKIKEINLTNHIIKVIISDPPYTRVEIKTRSVEPQLQKDDVIFVVGILKGEKKVDAEKILIKDAWADSIIFISSIPAIPFVIYLFFRSWRFNRKTFMFEWRRKDA